MLADCLLTLNQPGWTERRSLKWSSRLMIQLVLEVGPLIAFKGSAEFWNQQNTEFLYVLGEEFVVMSL